MFLRFFCTCIVVVFSLSTFANLENVNIVNCDAGESLLTLESIPHLTGNNQYSGQLGVGLGDVYLTFLDSFILKHKGFDLVGNSLELTFNSNKWVSANGVLEVNREEKDQVKAISFDMSKAKCTQEKGSRGVNFRVHCQVEVDRIVLDLRYENSNYYTGRPETRGLIFLYDKYHSDNYYALNPMECHLK